MPLEWSVTTLELFRQQAIVDNNSVCLYVVGDLSVDGKVIPMGGTKDHEMPTIRTFGSTTDDPNERIYDSTEKRTDDLYST